MVREARDAYLRNADRTLASHPTGHTVLPKALHVHTQAREETKAFFFKNVRLYLLSLAYPDHPRFKAKGRQAQQVQFWKMAVSMTMLPQKPYMKLRL